MALAVQGRHEPLRAKTLAGKEPAGNYRVFAQYHDDCGNPSSAYNVTSAVKNRAEQR